MRFYSRYFANAVINSVGALTSKPYVFKVRPWELKDYEIFDPTTEFYIPILVSTTRNDVCRVLPSTSCTTGKNYGWISNRVRFLGESLACDSAYKANFPRYSLPRFQYDHAHRYEYVNRSRIVESSWAVSVRRLGHVLACSEPQMNLATTYFGVDCGDLSSDLEYRSVCSQSHGQFGFFPSPQIHNWYKWALDQVEHTQPISLGFLYPKIFLIGFNPYFVDPTLTYCLNAAVNLNSSQLYTLMFSCITMNLRYKNMFPTIQNLNMLFLGKHSWSNSLYAESSFIVVDMLFLRTLPGLIFQIIMRFLFKVYHRVCIINANSMKFVDFGIDTDSAVQITQPFSRFVAIMWNSSYPFSVQISQNHDVMGESPFIGWDYGYTLTSVSLQFSQFKGFPNPVPGCLNFWFPVASFLNIATYYKFLADPVPHKTDRILTSLRKSIGQIFNFAMVRGRVAQNYGHFNFQNRILVAFIILVFYQYALNVYSIAIIRGADQNWFSPQSFSNYLVPFRWDVFNGFRSRYYVINSNSSTNYRFDSGYLVMPLYECYWPAQYQYSGSDLTSVYDSFVLSSKTLSLERAFKISRFVNFKY